MYLDTNECFKLCNDGSAKINVTRFGDFFVMASRGDKDEVEHYSKELKYIINNSRDVLENKKTIIMFKKYKNIQNEEIKYVFNDLDKFNEYIEFISKVSGVEEL